MFASQTFKESWEDADSDSVGQRPIQLRTNATAAGPQSTLWVLTFPLLMQMNFAVE